MANDQEFIDFVVEQVENGCDISYRNMFGGTTLYMNGKVVALICDNQLFVKPTATGRAYIGLPVEAPPYPGAKDFFLVQDEIEDAEWLIELLVITEQELPAPRPKKKPKRKGSS